MIHFSVNVPYWDDFDSVLSFIERFNEAQTVVERIVILFDQHNEHRIIFDKFVFLAYYYLFGEVNFKAFIYFGNIGWICAVLVLIWALKKATFITFPYLFPVPFILLAVIHWENMFFAMASIQNYWFIFFSVCFVFTVSRGDFIKSLFFLVAATFTSGGAFALYPIGAVYLWRNKKWKKLLIFLLLALLLVSLYFVNYQSPSNGFSAMSVLSEPLRSANFFSVFMGNFFPVKYYELTQVAGAFIVFAAIYYVLSDNPNSALKMILSYTLLVAMMAVFSRSGFGVLQAAASRYSMYSILAVVCLYLLTLETIPMSNYTARRVVLGAGGIIAIIIWTVNLSLMIPQFRNQKHIRIDSIESYCAGNSSKLNLLYPDVVRATYLLSNASRNEVYNYNSAGCALAR